MRAVELVLREDRFVKKIACSAIRCDIIISFNDR